VRNGTDQRSCGSCASQCTRRRRCLVTITALMCCSAIATQTPAGLVVSRAPSPDTDSPQSGAYCGVYCLYAAIRLEGGEVSLPALVTPSYISSRRGSSSADLVEAGRAHGMHVLPMRNLSTGTLRNAAYPIILHVKRQPGAPAYDHWVLFVGMDGPEAMLYEPPGSLRRLPLDQLLPVWDRTGLIVSRIPVSSRSLIISGVSTPLLFASSLIAAGGFRLARRWIARRGILCWARFGRPVQHCCHLALVLGITASLALAYNAFAENGLLNHRQAVAQIQQSYASNFLPKFSLAKTRRALGGGLAVVIDARPPEDFDAGHLPGAVNIPVDATTEEIDQQLEHAPRDGQVVVYCQSSGCPYAKLMAARLTALGFTKVAIFSGGWHEWKRSMGS